MAKIIKFKPNQSDARKEKEREEDLEYLRKVRQWCLLSKYSKMQSGNNQLVVRNKQEFFLMQDYTTLLHVLSYYPKESHPVITLFFRDNSHHYFLNEEGRILVPSVYEGVDCLKAEYQDPQHDDHVEVYFLMDRPIHEGIVILNKGERVEMEFNQHPLESETGTYPKPRWSIGSYLQNLIEAYLGMLPMMDFLNLEMAGMDTSTPRSLNVPDHLYHLFTQSPVLAIYGLLFQWVHVKPALLAFQQVGEYAAQQMRTGSLKVLAEEVKDCLDSPTRTVNPIVNVIPQVWFTETGLKRLGFHYTHMGANLDEGNCQIDIGPEYVLLYDVDNWYQSPFIGAFRDTLALINREAEEDQD